MSYHDDNLMSGNNYVLNKWASHWLSLTAFFRQQGPCNKLCNHDIYIRIIMFPMSLTSMNI